MLGNGPSLNDDISKINSEKYEADIACVNAFPTSEHFKNLKPKYLFLSDTAWWRKDPGKEYEIKRDSVYKNINSIEWGMQVFIPYNANLDFLEKKIHNKHIDIIKIKSASNYHILNKSIFKYYDTGYINPPLSNVLIFSNFCLVKMGYQELDIYGADLSYILLIDIDQETNQLIVKNEHFYKKSEAKPMLLNAGKNSEYATMHDFLKIQALTYKGHELINEYAKLKGIKITNKSAYSTIDSYDRE